MPSRKINQGVEGLILIGRECFLFSQVSTTYSNLNRKMFSTLFICVNKSADIGLIPNYRSSLSVVHVSNQLDYFH